MSSEKNNNDSKINNDVQAEDDRVLIDDTSLDDVDLSTSNDAAEPKNLAADLEKQKQEYLYLRAEFDNFRKQSIKERSDLVRFGAERISRDLLNVIDLMEKAMSVEVTPETISSYVEGISLTAKELNKTLEKHGIREIDCKNKAYDPMNAEALSQVPSNEVSDGHVLEVMRKGYKYHEKVLRPAQVVIATKPQEDSAKRD